MDRTRVIPAAQALGAAVLFGISAPLSKLMLVDTGPAAMVALLYLGSGLGLLCLSIVVRGGAAARLDKKSLLNLGGMVLAGGVMAPLLLMFSLPGTPAAPAALLLNFESVATTALAWVLFGEHVGRRIWLGVGVVTAASILLTLDAGGSWGVSLGAIGIMAACFFWGLDNNFSRNVSSRDPLSVVMLKGLAASAFSFILLLLSGLSLPPAGDAAAILIIGFLCYGLSAYLLIVAMRSLGAARAVAYFAAAPFIGALFSFALFAQMPGWTFLVSFPLMAAGSYLLVTENHSHAHIHKPVTHTHPHLHDDVHHRHKHDAAEKTAGRHTHRHVHGCLAHAHEHAPDIHHRHSHT